MSLKDKALFEQAASVELATFFPLVLKVFMASIIKKQAGLQTRSVMNADPVCVSQAPRPPRR